MLLIAGAIGPAEGAGAQPRELGNVCAVLSEAVARQDLAGIKLALQRVSQRATAAEMKDVEEALAAAWKRAKYWPLPDRIVTTAPDVLPVALRAAYGQRTVSVATAIIEAMSELEGRLGYRFNWDAFIYAPRNAHEWIADLQAAADAGDPRAFCTVLLGHNDVVADLSQVQTELRALRKVVAGWPVPVEMAAPSIVPSSCPDMDDMCVTVGVETIRDKINRLIKLRTRGEAVGLRRSEEWWYVIGEHPIPPTHMFRRAESLHDLAAMAKALDLIAEQHDSYHGTRYLRSMELRNTFSVDWPLPQSVGGRPPASIPERLRGLYGARTVTAGVRCVEVIATLQARFKHPFDWSKWTSQPKSSQEWMDRLRTIERAGEPRAMALLLLLEIGRRGSELAFLDDPLRRHCVNVRTWPIPVGIQWPDADAPTTSRDPKVLPPARRKTMWHLIEYVRKQISCTPPLTYVK